MPRKNLKRKNTNSQSGGSGGGGGRRRKSKPIKFNPNDIENEQKLMLGASIEKDDDDNNDNNDDDGDGDTATVAIEMDGHNEVGIVEHGDNECNVEKTVEQDMQSINGSESIQVNENISDTTTAASSNCVTDNDNACPSNQMGEIDDVRNEDDATAATVIAAAVADAIAKLDGAGKSDNLLSNRTFNYYHFRFISFRFVLLSLRCNSLRFFILLYVRFTFSIVEMLLCGQKLKKKIDLIARDCNEN